VEWLKSFDIIVHPRCQHLIGWLTHALTVLTVLEDKRTNYMIDALGASNRGGARRQAAFQVLGGWMMTVRHAVCAPLTSKPPKPTRVKRPPVVRNGGRSPSRKRCIEW